MRNHSPVEPPSTEEVIAAIKSLKNNKAPGIDTITAELLKVGEGGDLSLTIHSLVKEYGTKNNSRKTGIKVLHTQTSRCRLQCQN